MVRLRPIKMYGDSVIIRITKQDLKDLGWAIGENIDIDNFKKVDDGN